MRELPSGTVTFLFTDIEGSTRLLHELGDEAYASALAGHRMVVRKALTDHGGVEVDTQGDAFFAAFPTAASALAAASQATDDLSHGPIRMRIGLHTGSPILTNEGYVGEDVHRAARIAASSHGGQVILSAATASLLDRADLRDLGEHRFKDLAGPEHIFQLGDAVFPPLKSLQATNLPVPATPFIGRDEELFAVVGLLKRDDLRLLTLAGMGGTGKTRLALQAAAEVSDGFPDGTWWVPLAALRESALVLPTVMQILGVTGTPTTSPEESLRSGLSGKRALILLDNCEHLLPEVAAAVASLRDIGTLKIVVTSRERLRIRGEQTYQVSTMNGRDAAALFEARARAVDASFVGDPAVTDLCVALDELPLAIELAAARTPLFGPAQLLDRLGQRFELLRGDRDVDPRQQTLAATIRWSYDLLSDREQDLLRRFSVFVGGCSYEAAEHVIGAEPDTLQSLLDKSLIRRRDSDAGPRFWMLETIREFAAEWIASSDELADVRLAHARWFSVHAARLCMPVRDGEPGAHAALVADVTNIRAALALAFSVGDLRLSGDCLFGLWFHWLTEGFGHEARTAADSWLASPWRDLADLERVPGLLASGEVIRYTGDSQKAADLKRELLAIARLHADESVHGWRLGQMIPALMSDLSYLELANDRLSEARAISEEALSIRRALGKSDGICHALVAVGTVDEVAGDLDGARSSFEEAAELAPGTIDAWFARLCAVECEALLGNLEVASSELQVYVDEIGEGTAIDVTDVMRVAATLSCERGQFGTAAELIGAFVNGLENAGMPYGLDPLAKLTHDRVTDRARAALGDRSFERARALGCDLSREQVLERVAKTVADRAS